jgi:diguanylate cyclase (GGDEF)-like protein
MVNKTKGKSNHAKKDRAKQMDVAEREVAAQSAIRDKSVDELIASERMLVTLRENEKSKRVAELNLANLELNYHKEKGDKRRVELAAARAELAARGDERDKLAAELHDLAFYDPLTGVGNRRLVLDRIGHALAVAARSNSDGVVMHIDLDNLQELNETLGRRFGDLLLRQVARRLEYFLGGGDTLARDGDEFLVVLVGLDRHRMYAALRAQAIGEEMLAALRAPYDLDGQPYELGASIGAVMFSDVTGVEGLLNCAEIAMSQAKVSDSDSITFFDQHMQEVINARAALKVQMTDAITRNEFRLHYQPIVDRDRKQVGVEALIRWQHPERGMILPGQFISTAETTGLIVPIGVWVLDEACQQLKRWQSDATTKALNLSVNVSAVQFSMPAFVPDILARVKATGIDPHRLKIEITENVLLEDADMAIEQISALQELGVQLSLDDFGTGYSSLQYLKQLPLDEIKVDMMFVRGAVDDARDRAIVQAIITLAADFGLSSVAEGVETEEQMTMLMGMGCQNFQGYLFGKAEAIG